jgi:hypothetical protein
MDKPGKVASLLVTLLAASPGACSPSGDEPATVYLPVRADGAELLECTNDEGWAVRLAEFRLAVRNIELTLEGETHARLFDRLSDLLVPRALAHPGHSAGGEVAGELSGDFLLELSVDEPQPLGDAALLTGDYFGVNLTFRRAGESDGLPDDDPLPGHTAFVSGTATRDDETVDFTAVLDVKKGTQMVGGPFELEVTEQTEAVLALRVYTIDPSEGDTLFDGLDFAALDGDGDGEVHIEPGQAAHNVLMKTLIRHDHYGIEVVSEKGE